MRNNNLINDTTCVDGSALAPPSPEQHEHHHENGLPARWKDKDFLVLKYIDDTNGNEKLLSRNAAFHLSAGKPCAMIHAQKSQHFFREVKRNAEIIGMKVNGPKTQLLCVGSTRDFDTKSYIEIDQGTRVVSGESLKILGFHFGTGTGVGPQVQKIQEKFRKRAWIIRNLKRSGLPEDDLIFFYKTLVRPVLDFTAPVYHSMLTVMQSEALERLQRNLVKLVCGREMSYEKILEKHSLPTLAERRQTLVDNFALKAADSPRFGARWFPRKPESAYGLRDQDKFQTFTARTERMKNSPVYHMRERLNAINRAAAVPASV